MLEPSEGRECSMCGTSHDYAFLTGLCEACLQRKWALDRWPPFSEDTLERRPVIPQPQPSRRERNIPKRTAAVERRKGWPGRRSDDRRAWVAAIIVCLLAIAAAYAPGWPAREARSPAAAEP